MAARVQPVVKPAHPYDSEGAQGARNLISYSHTTTSLTQHGSNALQDTPDFYRRSRAVVEEYCDPAPPGPRLLPRWCDREME